MNYFSINVSLNGVHFFATSSRSITDRDHLAEVWKVINQKFPKEEGYQVTCTEHKLTGRHVPPEEILSK